MSNNALYSSTYNDHLAKLRRQLDENTALQQAVGGNFIAVGQLEYSLLRQLGLRSEHLVVDVGCGSGRLASQLAALDGVRYVGTDVVPELLAHARKLSQRPEWRFETATGLTIPVKDASADFVCFFSVLTHLRHEDSYAILREARRVLKPGGRLVFSFLEFRIPSHWTVFESMIGAQGGHVNQFMDRDAIHAWASHLNLTVDVIHDGDKPHIPLEFAVTWDDGRTMEREGNLGQSVAVLSLTA